MIKSIRHGLQLTALACTPFLLTACGNDDGTQKSVILILPALILALSTAHHRLRTRA